MLQSGAVERATLSRLVRPGEAPTDGKVSMALDETFPLLATDELQRKTEAYLETGDIDVLIDIRELAAVCAAIQGVGPEELALLSDRRRTRLGTYWGRVVLHAEDGAA